MGNNKSLGFGKRRLIADIIKKTWNLDNPYDKKLTLNDVLYIIQEMQDEEGKKFLEDEMSIKRGNNVFKMFARHLLYRNIANYDSMVLMTSEKGCLTDDTLLMVPRDLEKYPDGVPLKELIDKGPLKVYSFNKRTKKIELKDSDGVEFAKYDDVYELTFSNGYKIKSTGDHPFMIDDGSYIQARNLKHHHNIRCKDFKNLDFDNTTKIKNKKHIGKQNVYDVVNVHDNHNFIANGLIVSNTGKCMYVKDDKDFVVSVDGNLIHPKDAEEIVFIDNDMKLKTGKVKKHYNRKEKNIFEVKLRSGKKIYLTKEHPLKTIYGWKPLKDLKENDFIATPRKYSLKNNGNMNKGLIKLLAYIIVDGYMGGRKLEFTKKDLQIRNDFKKALYDFDRKLSWGESTRIINKNKSKNKNGQYNSNNSLMNYLKEIGLYEKRSGDKFIPKEILILKNEHIALFLNRLYSCDGGVEIGKQKNKTREINYTTKSELMARQIQHLLLRFNIQASLKSKNKRDTNSINHKGSLYWQLTISGKENIINFKKNIGFFHKEKNKKLNQIYNNVINLKSKTNVDIIPKGVFEYYNFNTSSKEYAKIFNVKSVRLNSLKNANISRYKFKQIANAEQDESLLKIADSDIFWDKILSIKKIDSGEVTVYDLEVDDPTHNFVANDIIIHNSSAAIMLARQWCQLLGIRFDPKRHLAYNNRDVMEKIDMLNKFEPLVCLTGDTLIKIRYNGKEYEERIDKLVDMNGYEVLTYNIEKNIYEYKIPEKTIEQPKKDSVYIIKLKNGKTLKATKNHLVLTNKGYKEIKKLTLNDKIRIIDEKYITDIEDIKIHDEKTKVYDMIHIPDNHNFIANGVVVHNCDEAVRFACLSGDTLISTSEGNIKISELEGRKNFEVFSFNETTNKIELKKATRCIKTKRDIIYEITMEDGKKIKATKEHKFLTKNGWKTLDKLKEGDDLVDI